VTVPPQEPIPLRNVVPSPLRSFGKYLLVRKLAEGGMAEIFLAKQLGAEGFERDVVIKCMLTQFGGSKEFIDMFLDEARVAARLVHPNIVQILDLDVADSRHYICMEYLAGEDLEAIIARLHQLGQQIPVPLAAKIILGACEGLEFAHSHQSLVHRDISPSNIFVTYQGTPKILDFGIAKAASKSAHTQPGTLKGKLGYMSPEQVRGAVLDSRSDIFSLGVTFFELLTGRRVFERDSELGILMALMEQPVVAPSTLRPDLPKELDRIILKALARHVEDRYANSGELRAELEAFLATQSATTTTQVAAFVQGLFGQPHVQRKTTIPTLKELELQGLTPAPSVQATERTFVRGADPSPASGFKPMGQRRRLLPWVAAMVLLTMAGAGAWWYRNREAAVVGSENPPQSPAAAVVSNADSPPVPAAPETKPAPPMRRTPVVRTVVLDRQDVAQVLQRHGARILSCGETHRQDIPEDGVVKVLFTVENSGSVKDARVTTESLVKRGLGLCLVQKLSALRFPKNANHPELIIEQPLRFQKQ